MRLPQQEPQQQRRSVSILLQSVYILFSLYVQHEKLCFFLNQEAIGQKVLETVETVYSSNVKLGNSSYFYCN